VLRVLKHLQSSGYESLAVCELMCCREKCGVSEVVTTSTMKWTSWTINDLSEVIVLLAKQQVNVSISDCALNCLNAGTD
jgi:hypothetical protein